ncbi:MAG: transcription termination factor NusA [Victivallaceae bacterium]|nr:transcription termination factor NusA [Victivallaceae bacterium]
MANELLTILEYIEQERGISRDVMVDAVENALLSASRKSIHPATDLKVKVDHDTGDIRAWANLEIVESDANNDQLLLARALEKDPAAKVGDQVDWEVTPRNFGRIAAQAAKQAIMQQLRKAEKDIVKEEFSVQIGHIINGTVRRFENGGVVIDFQKAEGILPSREKIHGEHYMAGDRIMALLLKVDISSGGPSLVVSRTHPNFVKALFEREVSEIHDGAVEIMGISREPGGRSKIAVRSNDSRIDPVGACVGMRGMRVKNITAELNGERIDIIPYDENIAKYAANALQPAKVLRIEVNEAKHILDVYVAPDQSRLVYGKKAQNVKLSSRLLGWSFNIIVDTPEPEETMADKMNKAVENLAEALDTDKETAGILVSNGFLSADGLKAVSLDSLVELPGVDVAAIEKIVKKINTAD